MRVVEYLRKVLPFLLLLGKLYGTSIGRSPIVNDDDTLRLIRVRGAAAAIGVTVIESIHRLASCNTRQPLSRKQANRGIRITKISLLPPCLILTLPYKTKQRNETANELSKE